MINEQNSCQHINVFIHARKWSYASIYILTVLDTR